MAFQYVIVNNEVIEMKAIHPQSCQKPQKGWHLQAVYRDKGTCGELADPMSG